MNYRALTILLAILYHFSVFKKAEGKVAEKLRKHYRCLKPILPQANIAIFKEDKAGALSFQHWDQEKQRPPNELGYLGSSLGDSGSSYVKLTEDRNGEERNVMISIHGSGMPHPTNTEYSDDALNECRLRATKISSDVLGWIRSLREYEKLDEKDENTSSQRGLIV